MARIQFNAFDKHSSASMSKTVEVENVEQLRVESQQFDTEVPFTKFYRDSEVVEGDGDEDVFEAALEELDEG